MSQESPARLSAHNGRYGYYVLAVLFSANLLNYIDRQVIYAVFPLIKADLDISDTTLGILGSVFMFSYMLSAPLFGWIGDRFSRVRLAATGLVLWSIATAAAALSRGYCSLLSARAFVGIGEASFGSVSPGIISDFFGPARRGRIFAFFYLAIPVGSALGYVFGGYAGHHFSWQAAFLVAGLPGLLLALPVWFLREPLRGAAEEAKSHILPASSSGYMALISNRAYLLNTLSMTAMTFALGGLAQWVPTFLFRMHNLDVADGNMLFGAVTIVAGIMGTLAGGWLGDFFERRRSGGHLRVAAWGFAAAVPIAVYAITAESTNACMAGIFAAEFFLFLSTGPQNTVIVNVTAPAARAMAFALNIFVIHALGDAISPVIIGALSDATDLRAALLITPAAIAVAAIFSFLCAAYIAKSSSRNLS